MNNKGQSLVMFILLLPLFIMFLALIVDIGLITNANIKYSSLAKDCLKVAKDKSKEECAKLLEANNLEKPEYEINALDNEIEVRIKTKVEAIFGTIINMKEYEINIVEKGDV